MSLNGRFMSKTAGREAVDGFGPEMYVLRKMMDGAYVVKANYYGSNSNRLSFRSRVFVTVYRNLGSDQESVERRAVTLDSHKQLIDVITLKAGK